MMIHYQYVIDVYENLEEGFDTIPLDWAWAKEDEAHNITRYIDPELVAIARADEDGRDCELLWEKGEED